MDYAYNHDMVTSPTPRTTPVGHLGKPIDRTLETSTEFGSRSVDASAEINRIPCPSATSTQSPVHFILDNFFFAVSLITLIIFTFFFAVTWFTVFQDARSITDRIGATGVSPYLGHIEQSIADGCCLGRCQYSGAGFNWI